MTSGGVRKMVFSIHFLFGKVRGKNCFLNVFPEPPNDEARVLPRRHLRRIRRGGPRTGGQGQEEEEEEAQAVSLSRPHENVQ